MMQWALDKIWLKNDNRRRKLNFQELLENNFLAASAWLQINSISPPVPIQNANDEASAVETWKLFLVLSFSSRSLSRFKYLPDVKIELKFKEISSLLEEENYVPNLMLLVVW